MPHSVLIVGPRGTGWDYLSAARRLGLSVAVAISREQAGEIPDRVVDEIDDLVVAQVLSADMLKDEADRLRFHQPLVAVIAGHSEHAAAAARLADRHGLPAVSLGAARAATDRSYLMARLGEAAMPHIPRMIVACDWAGVAAATRTLGFPCMARPQDPTVGSALRVDNGGELESAYDTAMAAARRLGTSTAMVLEQYVQGAEFALVGYVDPTGVRLIAIAEHRVGPAPHLPSLGYLVRPAEHFTWNSSAAWYLKLLASRIDLRVGVLRARVRRSEEYVALTGFGIGPGDEHFNTLVTMTTGMDLTHVDLVLHAGRRVASVARPQVDAAGVHYVIAPRLMGRTYRRLNGWRSVRRLDGVISAEVEIQAGELIPAQSDASGRLAHVIYAGGEFCATSALRAEIERTISVS